MSAIWGRSETKNTWYDGVLVAEGGQTRSRFVGSMRAEVVPGYDESYSEKLGVVNGPLGGDVALSRLGPTQAERVTLQAQARAAHVDATLKALGIRRR
jgi:hypothetical protein